MKMDDLKLMRDAMNRLRAQASRAGAIPTSDVFRETDVVMDALYRAEAALYADPTAEPPKPEAWCQPNYEGKIHPRKFMVVYEDAEMGNAVFDDETEAREHFEKASVNWNCYLFGLMPYALSVRQLSAAVPMTVINPDEWEPCSPAYLAAGGRCDAPRVWNHANRDHWHPKLSASSPSTKDADGLREVEAFAEKAINAIKEIANPDNDIRGKFVIAGPGGILAMACNAVRAALQSEDGK